MKKPEADWARILDDFQAMDWSADRLPLINFLNLTQVELGTGYSSSGIRKEIELTELYALHQGLRFVLESLWTEKNKEQIEKLLTAKWAAAEHIVEVEGKRVYTEVPVPDDLHNKVWLDLITDLLYGQWWKRTAMCSTCERWFYRAKSDKAYCGKPCKNKADYEKNRGRRTAERRARYQRDKEPTEADTKEEA